MASREVLLLSTDIAYTASLCKFLEQEDDVKVLTESDMGKAIDIINWSEFDAILCDHSPTIDSLALVSSMRDNHFNTPFIIIFDPQLGESMTAKAMSAGATYALRRSGGLELRALLVMLETAWNDRDRMQQALDAAETQQRILNRSPELILALDAQLRVRYINEHALEFFSLESSAVLGRPVIGRILPPVGQDGKDILVKLFGWMEKGIASGPLPVYRQGHTLSLMATASSWGEEGGKGMFLFLTPPNSPCRVGEGHCVLEKIKESIISIDHDGKITFVNAEAERFLEKDRFELLGRFVGDVYPPVQGTNIEEMIKKAVSSRVPMTFEVQVPRFSGEMDWLDVHTYPHTEGLNVIFHPITDRKVIEERLRSSEELYRSVVEQTSEGVMVVDESLKVEFINQQMAGIIGIPINKMVGKNLLEFVDPEDHTLFVKALEHSREHTVGTTGYMYRGSDGRRRHLDINLAPRRYPDGLFHGAIAMVTDDTERAAEQAKMRFQAQALSNINAGLAVVDTNGKIIFWNPRAEQLFGFSSEETVGKLVVDVLAPGDSRYAQPVKDAILGQGTFEIENWQTRKDGSKFLAFMQLAKVTDGKGAFIGTVTLINDITANRQLQEQLKQANQKLTLMAAVTRHDIANQMQILSGQLALAEEASSLEESKGFVSKAETNLRNVNSLLEFSKDYLKIGTMEPNWVRAEDLFRASYRHLEVKGIKFNCGVRDLGLFVDPMLEKVFYNLVDNSLRHGGKVTEISLSYHDDGDNVVMVYEDDGTGIPTDKKQAILDERSGRYGMRLVKEILQINGISIKETGSYHKGVRFEMTVPKERFRIAPASI